MKADLKPMPPLRSDAEAEAFVEAYCVRMRGGTLRLQAQYLRTIRLPHADTICTETAHELRLAFAHRDRARASAAARVAYGLESEQELAS